MKRLYFILIAVAALFCCAACKSSNGPEKVAKDAIEALQKKDYDAYAATFNLSSSEQEFLSGMVEEKMDKAIEEKGGIKSYKITDSQVDGDKATVKVHFVYKDGSEEDQKMSFVKVGDDWKQELDK